MIGNVTKKKSGDEMHGAILAPLWKVELFSHEKFVFPFKVKEPFPL